ncbi:MAG: C1 family peptidase [Myxococcota bacterium]
MTKAKQFQGLFLLTLTLAACAPASVEEPAEDSSPGGKADDADGEEGLRFAAYEEAPRWCNETDGACLVALGQLTPLNVDFSSGDARDQGTIASCASHSFIGMLETQLAAERGILVDLSERYQLYANFMATGNMGDEPDVIVTFPEILENFGVMPEAAYPYDAVLQNAHRFSQDLAQGIEDDGAITIDVAVAQTDANSRERFEVLTADDALGALPQVGKHPITLPVQAELMEGAIVPEVEVRLTDGSILLLPCFSDRASEVTFDVTPREFLGACFDHDPADYYACQTDLPEFVEREDDCSSLLGYVDGWQTTLNARLSKLATVLHSLDHQEAVFVGVDTPYLLENKSSPLWHSQSYLGAGHAVTAVGYITADKLGDPDEQSVGLLEGPSMFDAFADQMEPDYGWMIQTARASGDAEWVAEVRTESALGQRVVAEGGMILFRNSWGSELGDIEIGVDGFQAMTFRYFLARLMLIEARGDVGPEVCGFEIGYDDPFFETFADDARNLAWDAVKAQFLTSAGEDAEEMRAAIEDCRAAE